MYDHEGRRRAVAARAAASFRSREARRDRDATNLSKRARQRRGDELAREKAARIGGRGGEGRVTERDGRKGWGDGVAGMDHLAAPQSSNEI